MSDSSSSESASASASASASSVVLSTSSTSSLVDNGGLNSARDAFQGLHPIDWADAIIVDIEMKVTAAVESNKDPSELIPDFHMLFLAPPSLDTDATTIGSKYIHHAFVKMFHYLGVLPTDHLESTTANQLVSRYLGGTRINTQDAIDRAKGGVLMIHDMTGPRKSPFMQEIFDCLILNEQILKDNKTILIIKGCEEDINAICAYCPGFSARFDRTRLHFPASHSG